MTPLATHTLPANGSDVVCPCHRRYLHIADPLMSDMLA